MHRVWLHIALYGLEITRLGDTEIPQRPLDFLTVIPSLASEQTRCSIHMNPALYPP